jgi:hypothetical protein
VMLIIEANKRKFPFSLIIGIIISVLLVYAIISHKNDSGVDGFMYIVNYLFLSVFAIGFTLIAFADYLKTLFDKKAVLTITEYGINDRLGIFSCGEISWAEVNDIKIINVLQRNLIIVILSNPTEIIEKQNKFKQWALKSLLKKFGSPMVIFERKIDFDLQELRNKMLSLKDK